MTPARNSLLRSLLSAIALPGIVAMLLGCVIVFTLFKDEYDELQDVGLTTKAHLLLALIEAKGGADALTKPDGILALPTFQAQILDPDERSVFWLLDPAGRVIGKSPGAIPFDIPLDAQSDPSTQHGLRVIVVASATDTDLRIAVAEPMNERNEAIRDVMSAVVFGFVLLGVLFYAAAFFTVRRSAGILVNLSENIAQKGAHDLSPIDRHNSFAEIEPAIETLDTLLARLDHALAAERAFATNAAHELRTPVAIALAHAQRLGTLLADPGQTAHVTEVEQALKRLGRLIERLLQMSRAQSGLGLNADVIDITPVIHLLLQEARRREPSDTRLIIDPPTGQWHSPIDPDALGIIVNNLIDNAFKHTEGHGPIVLDASVPGKLTVSNDCDPLSAEVLNRISRRFVRTPGTTEGFGLGLSIVQELCGQSRCEFTLASPLPGQLRGFAAVLTFPTSARG